MLIRVRPFRARAAWPCSDRGAGICRPRRASRADSRRHTSADAAAPHSRLGRAVQPAPACRARVRASWSAALLDRATLERAEAEALALRRGHARGAAGVGLGLARPTTRPPWRCAAGRAARRLGRRARRRMRRARASAARARAAGAASAGGRCRVLAATERRARRIARARAPALRGQGIEVALAPQRRDRRGARGAAACGDRARSGRARPAARAAGELGRRAAPRPGRSMAGGRCWSGSPSAALSCVPDATFAALTGADRPAVPVRDAAASRWPCGRRWPGPARSARAGTAAAAALSRTALLPVYTVLVPLFREANVLPGLIRSLRALDYPRGQARGHPGARGRRHSRPRRRCWTLDLPGNFRTLVVPDRQPRTKPKALELRAAVRARRFRRGLRRRGPPAARPAAPRAGTCSGSAPPELGCLQAQLNIYNPCGSWLTRQFTIEYSVLFDAILPALERLRLPVPLGGTSNHFPARHAGRASAPGTPTTSPRTPTSASASRAAGLPHGACWPRRRGRRRRRASASG